MKKVLLLTTIGTLLLLSVTRAQNVMDPADPIYTYNSSDPVGSNTNPTLPANYEIKKWIRTNTPNRVTWNTTNFKCYVFGGTNTTGAVAMRIRFPNNYNPNNAAKYPVMVFFHGGGEAKPITENQDNLYWGAQKFEQRINAGEWNGFLIFPQSTRSGWDDTHFFAVNHVIDTLAKYNNVDVDKVVAMGLSIGGLGAIEYARYHPTRVATLAPSSPALLTSVVPDMPDFLHIPTFMGYGGKDTNPRPADVEVYINNFRNLGGDLDTAYFPLLGHVCWNEHWDDKYPNGQYILFDYLNKMHKAQPLVYYNKNKYCIDSAVTAKIGLTAGFAAYEWQRQDTIVGAPWVTIAGATANEYSPTQFGYYRARFKRTLAGNWSEWSPRPVGITSKPLTQTPDIAITPYNSKVLPTLESKTQVPLELPSGFLLYEWRRVSDNAIVSTSRTYNAPAGEYKAIVKETGGCGALFSPNFKVVNAAGTPKPDAAKNLTAYPLSGTTVQLEWNNSASPTYNETGFEIYRATTAGGPYKFVYTTGADVLSYLDQGLSTNTNYYYIIRAVNETGAAGQSNEATVKTVVDNTPPTAPYNLKTVYTTRNSVELVWNHASDNVGVAKYDVYVNGTKMYTTEDSNFVVNNLTAQQIYTFAVKARDLAANVSPFSNQVTAATIYNGLRYSYYEGIWSTLPDFKQLTPALFGTSATPNIAVRPAGVTTNHAFLWKGFINITQTGTYIFYTSSADGSRMYFNNAEYSFTATPTVNNDGTKTNATEVASASVVINTAGWYPITVTYFQNSGTQAMELRWQRTTSPTLAKQAIPAAQFAETLSLGTAPAAPSSLVATSAGYNSIQLNWIDNSANETGFEVVRSTAENGTFTPVANVGANTASYLDQTNLDPNTKYFYQVRAINAAGASAFVYAYTQANWKLNNSLNEDTDATRNLAGSGTITYNAADKQEGTHSLVLNGSNATTTVSNSAGGGFPSTGGYTQRTVALWVKTSTTTNNRMFFDIGGNDNGMALRLSGTNLQAAMVSSVSGSAVRVTSSSVSVASGNANGWTVGGWNHVAVVYNVNNFKIFINGVERASSNISITSMGTSSSISQFGHMDGSNAFNDNTYSFFNGQMDDIRIINGALTAAEIVTIRNNTFAQSVATTATLPAAPVAPTVLSAQVISKTQINVSWTDNSANETGFELYRSTNDNSNFRLWATLAAGVTSYQDTGLFANVTYYYKVRSINAANQSAFSNEANGKTNNTKPAISKVYDFTMRYGTSVTIPITAADPDNDDLLFSRSGVPSFGTFTNISNGVAQLVLNPKDYQQGTYNIRIFVNDGNNGKDTMRFVLVVNENNPPVLNSINNAGVDEGGNTVVNLTASDPENSNTIRWFFTGLPNFAVFNNNGNGTGSITFTPGFAASGTYPITVKIDDGFGATATRTFNVTVNEKSPAQKWLVNIRFNTDGPTPWNNMSGASLTNLRNSNNVVTGLSVSSAPAYVMNTKWSDGTQTGNNSGIYPDAVLRDHLNFGSDLGFDTLYMTFSGLNPAKLYNLKFLASNQYSTANNSTIFRIGVKRDSVYSRLNTQNRASISGVAPSPGGQITFQAYKGYNSNNYIYLNAFEIEEAYDDGTAPAKPSNFAGTYIAGTGARLTWNDVAYNETAYQVFRAASQAGPYTQLNPGATNLDAVNYTDNTVTPSSTYYYFIKAINSYGSSANTDTVKVVAGNNAPIIAGLGFLYVRTTEAASSNFTVSDDLGDNITVSTLNMPGFLKLENMGGGAYRIVTNPIATADNLGWYTMTVKVTDDKGGITTQEISVVVSDIQASKTVLLNFGNNGKTTPAPWNNFLGNPYAGRNQNGLSKDDGNNSGFGINIVSSNINVPYFDDGFITGNGSGIVPDSVLQSYMYTAETTAQTFEITGLDNTKLYSFGFISSVNEGSSFAGTFAAGASSVTVQGRYNANQMVRLNGIAPTGGKITLSMTKAAAPSRWIALNGLIIQEYTGSATFMLSPNDLHIDSIGKTTVKLTWTDRASNENTYEVQRATSLGGTWTALTTALAASSTGYTDNTVTANTKYYYRVRSRQTGGALSEFSNVDSVVTLSSVVLVNLTNNATQAAPWNNSSLAPVNEALIDSLKNEVSEYSGVSVVLDKAFTGTNSFGLNTGANTGIFPDNVLNTNYTLNPGESSIVRITGLDHTKRYRIGISGSGGLYGTLLASYEINGRTAFLNGYNNSTKAIFIGNQVPDINGELLVNINALTNFNSAGAWTNALVVQAYTDAVGGTNPNQPNSGPGSLVASATDQTVVATNAPVEAVSIDNAYPNPFTDFVNLEFNNTNNNAYMAVEVYDLAGKKVMTQQVGAVAAGSTVLRINLAKTSLQPGVYMVRLNVNGLPSNTVKLVKAGK